MSNEEHFIQGESLIPEGVDMDTMLGLPKEKDEFHPVEDKPAQFKPKTPVKQETAKAIAEDQIQTNDADFNVQQRIKDLEANLKLLKEGEAVRIAAAKNKPLDFSKVKESDVFDLRVPIEAIVHELPDSTLLNLKDPTYIGRWVNINPMNMGKRKAAGFTFITKEDLDGAMMMDLEEDENGHFRYNDVVAMKISKQKYFGALRTNHLRAIAVVNQQKAQLRGKKIIENEMSRGQESDYQKYTSEGKLEVYAI